MEEITIRASDGHELPATLFESNAGLPGNGPMVLISSATAVPRRFYRHFAQFLADNGARAVMTYDYRGLDGQMNRSQAWKLRMADWATKDLPGAVKAMKERFSGHPLAGIGHSFGGQALGLSGVSEEFVRYMTLAAGSGWLGHTREERKLNLLMNGAGLPLAAAFGKLPRSLGMGEPLPFGAFNQWRRWCNSPDYFMSDKTVPETARFADVMIPMMIVGFEDDPWATRESVEALARWYDRADISLRWFDEREAGAPVGHFGFFRKDHSGRLWPQIADWVVRA